MADQPGGKVDAAAPEPSPAPPALGVRIKRVAAASAAARGVTEVVALLQTVVLARLLTPLEVGVFTAGTVLTAFLGNFAEGGMRAGLVHRERGLADAAETVFRGTLVTGMLMSLAALALAPVIGFAFGDSTAAMVAAVTSGALVLHALTNVPEAMLQRQFSVLRRLVVGPTITISFAVTSVTLAALGWGVWSLVAGTYVSHAAWVVSVWAISDWRPGRGRASWGQWRRLARYGLPLVVGTVGARTQQLVESVVVGRALGTSALGFYRYGMRISRIPVNATLEIVATALFPAFARIAGDAERLRSSFQRALVSVTVFAAAVSGLIVAVGEPAVVVLLGEPWRAAGAAVVAMAGLGLGKAFTSVSEEAIKGCGRTGLLNWLTATEFVLGVGLLVLIIPFGLFGVGLAISVTALTVGVLAMVLVRPLVGVTVGQLVRAIAPSVAAAVVATAATRVLEHDVLRSDTRGLPAGVGLLVVDALAFASVYLAVLAVFSPDIVRELRLLLLSGIRPKLARRS
jgi:O-antigen/teichoic acid export membrane protein